MAVIGVSGKTMAERISWKGQSKNRLGTMGEAMELDKSSLAAVANWLNSKTVLLVAIAH